MSVEATIVIEDMSSIHVDDKRDSSVDVEGTAPLGHSGARRTTSAGRSSPTSSAQRSAKGSVGNAAVRRRDLYATAAAATTTSSSSRKTRSAATQSSGAKQAAMTTSQESEHPLHTAPNVTTNAEQSTQIYTDEPPAATPSTELQTAPGNATNDEPDTALVSLLTRASETIKAERAQNATLSARVASLEAWLASLVAHCHADWLEHTARSGTVGGGDVLRDWLYAEAASWSRELHLPYDFTPHHRRGQSTIPTPTAQLQQRASSEKASAVRSPRNSYAAQGARGRSFPFITARDSAALMGQRPTSGATTGAAKDAVTYAASATGTTAASGTKGRTGRSTSLPGPADGSGYGRTPRTALSCRASSHTPLEPTHTERTAAADVSLNDTEKKAAVRSDANVVSMLTRLRRALAPPPSREQIGDVIEAMVSALQEDVQRRLRTKVESADDIRSNSNRRTHHGTTASGAPAEPVSCLFVRRGPTEYELLIGPTTAIAEVRRGRRQNAQPPLHVDSAAAGRQTCSLPSSSLTRHRLHLSIDSGQLCVAVGGGHVNILDYLERKLHCKL